MQDLGVEVFGVAGVNWWKTVYTSVTAPNLSGFETSWSYFEGSRRHWGWLSELVLRRLESSVSLFGAFLTSMVRLAGRRHDF